MRPLVLALALVASSLAGCAYRTPPEADYDVVPDEQLYAEVAALPAVLGEDLTWVNRFGQANYYLGRVFVEKRSDRCRVLDQTYAILRAGRAEAKISVSVVDSPPTDQPRQGLSMDDLDPDLGLVLDPGERYGAQPGTGEPPDDELCRAHPEATWDPVPDRRLFARVAAVPGVVDVDLRGLVPPDQAFTYRGTVVVRREEEWCRVLDRTHAILRAGVELAHIEVVAAVRPSATPGRTYSLSSVDADLPRDLEGRYGAQPGTGEPPDDALCADPE